jgi:GxxExxY protein
MKEINEITGQIVTAAFTLHSKIGPGLFESVYETLVAADLERRGLRVERQKEVPIFYEGRRFDRGFRADLIVEDCVLIEIKSVLELDKVFFKQTLTYLRLMDFRVGFLINFGAEHLRDSIHRIVNKFEDGKLRR